MATLACRVGQESDESHYEWKRIQMSEQQAQRERKNLIQKCLVFARRTQELMYKERVPVWYDGLFATPTYIWVAASN